MLVAADYPFLDVLWTMIIFFAWVAWYVREAAGGSAAEIAKAKELLDAGTITQAEFDTKRQKRFLRIEREHAAIR